MTTTTNPSIAKPFTQSWIQALTLAADNPLARTIKPKLEWIDRLSMNRADPERSTAAKELWDFAESEGLRDLLWLLPCNAATWTFDRDDIFQYTRTNIDVPDSQQANFERWLQSLGLTQGEFSMDAEVAGSDWSGLVRKEAVRLQHSLDTTAVQQSSNLTLPCKAKWNTTAWIVQFDQVDWIAVPYEDSPVVPRPAFAEIEERLFWLVTSANDALVSKRSTPCSISNAAQPWVKCSAPLVPLHSAFLKQTKDFSPWMARTWNCVWPIVYREQNLLKGLADIDQVRAEMKACLSAQPRLTMWMFVFAKLVCQLRTGRGLGIIADFHD